MTACSLPAHRVGSAFAGGCTLPPLAAEHRAAWHAGRRRYAIWMVEADTAAVRALCDSAYRHLQGWLGPQPARQPHITVTACGFPVHRARYADDFDAGQRRAQFSQLRAQPLPAASVRIDGIGSFNGCAFLRVQDQNGLLAMLHRRLGAVIPAAYGQRFVPHITLAPYRDVFALRDIAEAAQSWTGTAWLPVRHLTLAVFDPRSADGPLRPVVRVPLAAPGGA